MKKQFIAVFVALIALTIFSCREDKEQKVEENIEAIKADIQDETEEVIEVESDSLQIEFQNEETETSEE